MRYQAIITGGTFIKRISYKTIDRAMSDRLWWERAAEERGFELITFKVIDKETGATVFEKAY